MAQIREKKNIGPQGLADVRIMKDVVRIHFQEGDTYDFPLDALRKGTPQGKYIVTLSANKDKIFGLKPPKGQYILQFKQVGNRVRVANGDAGLPSSKIQHGGPRSFGDKHWIAADEIVWIAEVEVVDGLDTNSIYGGLTVATNLPYSFVRPATGQNTDYSDTKRNLKRLEDFFRVTAGRTLADIDIPYSDNSTELLLRYEKYILEDNRPFLGNLNERGFLDLNSISGVPVELLPKKKATKKGKK